MLSAVTESERLVRGRQIVARQRELAERLGNVLPIAVALLETYEKSLSLLEKACQRAEVLSNAGDNAVPGPRGLLAASSPNGPSPVDRAVPKLDYQARMREVALVMELLSEGGYDCELAKETAH
jgi:hypothetical protein